MSHSSKLIEPKEESWEPPDYSQLARSTGDNLDLRLALGGGQSWGPGPLPCGIWHLPPGTKARTDWLIGHPENRLEAWGQPTHIGTESYLFTLHWIFLQAGPANSPGVQRPVKSSCGCTSVHNSHQGSLSIARVYTGPWPQLCCPGSFWLLTPELHFAS